MHLRSVRLPGYIILRVVPHAVKTIFFSQNKCVVEVKLKPSKISCNLSGTKVTEYDLIWARAGKLNLSHEEAEKMVFCPVYRHSLGIIILATT